MPGYTCKIVIEDTHPPVWRRVIIPDQITFLNRLNKTEQSDKTSQSVAKEKVKTGDNSTIWGYILLLVSSILCFVIFFYEKQRRKKGESQDEAE